MTFYFKNQKNLGKKKFKHKLKRLSLREKEGRNEEVNVEYLIYLNKQNLKMHIYIFIFS